MSTLLIRADASSQMGTGHVMRCLALAQSWQDRGGDVTFAVAEIPGPIAERLLQERISVQRIDFAPGSTDDADALHKLADGFGTNVIVLDGYHFGMSYHRRLQDAHLWVLAFDDCGLEGPIYLGGILNQNIQADPFLYPNCSNRTKLLLGTKYAMLRREFRQNCPDPKYHSEVARNILVTMGGADPENVTEMVLRALAISEADDFSIRVIVGAGNTHTREIEATVRDLGGRAETFMSVRDMSSEMAWADLAVSAGGSTIWELAYMGVPSVLLTLAENQRPAVELLNKHGCFMSVPTVTPNALVHLSKTLDLLMRDRRRRKEMSIKCMELVDGKGPSRVVEYLESHY